MADKQQHAIGGAPVSSTGKAMDNVIPQTPPWLIYVRYAQVVLTLVVLICAAVSLAAFARYDYGYLGYGPGFSVFTCVYTFLFLAGVLLFPRFCPQFYFKWFHLGAECFCVLWWLVSWSGLAVWSTAFAYLDGTYSDGIYRSTDNVVKTIHGATAAGAAFGAFLWVSFIVTLVFDGIGCHRARIAKRNWNTPGNVEASLGAIGMQQGQHGI